MSGLARQLRVLATCAVAVFLIACGDDDGGSNNQNQTPDPVCGNGVVETGEQCDDGVANSDNEPNACRSNCRTAYCGDSVRDEGEHCDDGDAASVRQRLHRDEFFSLLQAGLRARRDLSFEPAPRGQRRVVFHDHHRGWSTTPSASSCRPSHLPPLGDVFVSPPAGRRWRSVAAAVAVAIPWQP